MKPSDQIKDELKFLAPHLAKLKEEQKGDGFTVSPRYFRELESEVLEKIQAQKRSVHPFWQQWLQWIMVPPRPVIALTTCLLLVAAVWWLLPQTENTDIFADTSDIALEDLEMYVSSNLDEFSPELIMDVTQEQTDLGWELSLEDLSQEEMDNLLEEYIDDIDQETLEQIL